MEETKVVLVEAAGLVVAAMVEEDLEVGAEAAAATDLVVAVRA